MTCPRRVATTEIGARFNRRYATNSDINPVPGVETPGYIHPDATRRRQATEGFLLSGRKCELQVGGLSRRNFIA